MERAVANLSLDALVHFHFIAKHQSLKSAAQALGLSPPALTHSLNKLERSLGVTLCQRGKSGFLLTENGKLLARKAETIVAEMGGYLASLASPEKFSGILSIGVLDHFENALFDTALEKVVKTFPAVKLNLMVVNSDEIQTLILSGELDLGFGIFHNQMDSLKYLTVGAGKMRYYISDRHPYWKKPFRQKEDLYGLTVTWVDSQKRNIANLENEVFCEHPNYKMKVSGFSNSLDGAMKILLCGHAIVPLPPSFVESLNHKGRIRELKVETKARTLMEHCVHHPSRTLSPPAQKIVDFISSKKA